MNSNISSTTLQSWRERPPSSYSIKVKIVSELHSSTIHSYGKYQSRRFSSGGHNWRMIIYPKGNENDNGSWFISMYVEIDSTSLISTQSAEVYADLRFFIFNKKENKYFTVQDVESKSFSTLRTMWGLPQVLPLDAFTDRKNGYILDADHCEFGVDIFVIPPPTKWEIISFGEELLHPKFSWTVKNFSEIKENLHTSNSFPMGGKKWVLHLYPNGYTTAGDKWLSIFLFLADGETLKKDEKIYIQGNVKVEDPRGSNHLTAEVKCWFANPDIGHGWSDYVALAEIQSYLDKEDTLKVEIEFKVVSATEYSSLT